jgi:hypothetical protein
MNPQAVIRRIERLLGFLLAAVIWILADVAPSYHTENAAALHGFYTFIGFVAFAWATWLPHLGKERRREQATRDDSR